MPPQGGIPDRPRPKPKPKPKPKTYPATPPYHIFGLRFDFTKGYDAWSRRNSASPTQDDATGYFTRLDDPSQVLYVWLDDLTVDFTLSGQLGQSQFTREFFPRSFNDVTVNMTGQVASTTDYNELAKYVRLSHWAALGQTTLTNSKQRVSPLLRFNLNDRTPRPFRNPVRRHADVSVKDPTGGDDALASTKGRHRPWQISGYIKEVTSGAVKNEIAPRFQLSFIVAESQLNATTGIWQDATDQNPQQLLDIVAQNLVSLTNGQVRAGGRFIENPHISGQLVRKEIGTIKSEINAGINDFINQVANIF